MTGRRTYADPCGIARALDLVGDRWALLVVRELVLGPQRFTDLRTTLTGLATDVLTQRLRDLEAAGVVRRRRLPGPATSTVYELTDRGRELEEVLIALGRWGSREPLPASGHPMSTAAFALALRTQATGDLTGRVALQLGSERLFVNADGATLEVRRADPGDQADAVIHGDVPALREVLWRGRSVTEAGLRLDGDRRLARRFLRAFPPPRAVRP